ncbi:MAG: hypothetical protein OXQ93_03960 [Gemmatimonadota bacterium]|nr:hypothetical protein [Gemmatimonadota bacterium]
MTWWNRCGRRKMGRGGAVRQRERELRGRGRHGWGGATGGGVSVRRWGGVGEEGGVCHEDDGRRRRIGIVMQLRLRDAVRLDSGNGAVAWRRLAARVAGEG